MRASKTLPLGDLDREAFYQMLHALGKPEAAKLKATGPDPLDPVPLLKAPEEHHGEVLRVRGRVQRVMKVPVEDADIQRRFGIKHYYEIDLFLPLGDTSLRFGKDPKGEKNPVYGNTFPVTLIVRELPPDLPEGENVRDVVRADGVFFKVWTYRSKYTDKFNQLQPALMFLAAQPDGRRATEPRANVVISALVIAAFVRGGGDGADRVVVVRLDATGRRSPRPARPSRKRRRTSASWGSSAGATVNPGRQAGRAALTAAVNAGYAATNASQ